MKSKMDGFLNYKPNWQKRNNIAPIMCVIHSEFRIKGMVSLEYILGGNILGLMPAAPCENMH